MRSAFLTGRLGRDPEIRYSKSGTGVMSFSIANDDESKKIGDNEYKKETNWFDIVFFTQKVDYWSGKLKKGTPIAAECDVKQEKWQTSDGQNRSKISFIIKKFPYILDQTKSDKIQSGSTVDESGYTGGSYEDDDIPF